MHAVSSSTRGLQSTPDLDLSRDQVLRRTVTHTGLQENSKVTKTDGCCCAVGWAASTFSISVREARILEGAPEDSMRLVEFDWGAPQGSQVPKECRE